MVSTRISPGPRTSRRRREPADVDLDRLTPTGIRILSTAGDLFYGRGIGAVGMDEIADLASTTKKTIYDRFGSKEGLVTAYLRRRCRVWQEYVEQWLNRSTATGADRALEPLRALRAWMDDHDRGCAFINAYAELAGTGHAGLAVIAEEKLWMRRLYTGLIEQAGLDRPQSRATRLSLVHEGMTIQLAVAGHVAAADEAMALARSVLAEGG
jgi:AcrR family transcriptional regulator